MSRNVLFSRASLFINLAIAMSIALTLVVVKVHRTNTPAFIYGAVMGIGVLSFLLAYRILKMERVYRDKLEEISATAAAAAELERRAVALESSLDGIAILGSNETYTFVNTAHANIYGYSDPSELIGKKWHVLYDPSELERFKTELMPSFYKQGRLRTEAIGLKKDGTPFPQEISLAAIPGGGLACFVRDLTDKKALESQLIQSQKMEALGLLAGGIAHDFNNLLTGVLGSASLLKIITPNSSQTYAIANDIEKAGLSARDLIQQLLGFARKGKRKQVQIDMHQMMHEVINILSRTIGSNIKITYQPAAENHYIEGDPIQIQQIIMNLALNARDAMDPNIGGSTGGVINFTTRSYDTIEQIGEISPGGYFELSVSDTGCGIDTSIKEKIFEPFFTTKKQGRGTGMGLAMVYGIVKNHSGHITVESAPGKGSNFKVVFPILDNVVTAKETIAHEKSYSKLSKLQIMVVDDHEIVRKTIAKMLTSLGCECTTIEDGHVAIEKFKSNPSKFDLAIVDLVMPTMSGKDCFYELRKISPKLPIIFVTGYSNDGTINELLQNEKVAILNKPFQSSELAHTISDLYGDSTVHLDPAA